jgi:hypothetical protein
LIKLCSVLALGLVLAAFLHLTSSAEEETVTANVTPITIAIQLTQTSLSYGSLQAGAPEVPSSPDNFGVINEGSVLLDYEIKGGHSTNGWTLAEFPAENTFRHVFSKTPGVPNSFAHLTTNYQALAQDVGIGAGFETNVFTRFTMPTSYTTTGAQSFPIVIRASMSTP